MSQANLRNLSNTKFSHPLANCPIATALYFEWTRQSRLFTKGTKEYQEAYRNYRVHLRVCDKCKEGLNDINRG